MELDALVGDIADGLVAADRSGPIYKRYSPGIGPFAEPDQVALAVDHLNHLPTYAGKVKTAATPDLLVPDAWVIEVKLARPFNNNGTVAEHWSEHLVHPYSGNESAIGDALKLVHWPGPERRAVLFFGYERSSGSIPPLDPALDAFELTAQHILHIKLGSRATATRTGLVHPVHQKLRIVGWEILAGAG